MFLVNSIFQVSFNLEVILNSKYRDWTPLIEVFKVEKKIERHMREWNDAFPFSYSAETTWSLIEQWWPSIILNSTWIVMNSTWKVMFQTLKTVIDHIFHHREGSWKYDAGYFWQTSRCCFFQLLLRSKDFRSKTSPSYRWRLKKQSYIVFVRYIN